MTIEQPPSSRLELVILEMRGSVDVRLAEIAGHLALLDQRIAATEQRQEDRERAAREAREAQAQQLARLDERVDALESNVVTRADLNSRWQRTAAALGLLITVIGIVASALTAVIIAIVNNP
ncbi:hypothetical protein [Thermomonospora cellulosilytica]|uniref:DNA-binding transcriptional MerR regulator n=1 Tax=Thermomonospora cellulosilytica TaxID=1411118 RepID=A0A7W3MXI0_9ACTN|nr:hypothetical protein [Thermomonospora cellulosilytica]MBA9003725.1 DNA-binding transcriptional MerR regulator [Thermomonospora cellulosilytica]